MIFYCKGQPLIYQIFNKFLGYLPAHVLATQVFVDVLGSGYTKEILSPESA
jgi:hypothetical protein